MTDDTYETIMARAERFGFGSPSEAESGGRILVGDGDKARELVFRTVRRGRPPMMKLDVSDDERPTRRLTR
jgi:hypothetical protein